MELLEQLDRQYSAQMARQQQQLLDLGGQTNRSGAHGELKKNDDREDGRGEGEVQPLSKVWESTQLGPPKGNEATHITMSRHSKQPYGFPSPNRTERRSPQPVRHNDSTEAPQGATLRVRQRKLSPEPTILFHYYTTSFSTIEYIFPIRNFSHALYNVPRTPFVHLPLLVGSGVSNAVPRLGEGGA